VPVSARPFEVAVADLNGDGKPDAVTANSLPYGVGILLGNGDGTFRPAVNISLPGACYFVAVGDLNGDGKPDVVASLAVNPPPGQVAVLLGNGDGTFKKPKFVALSGGPYGLAIADFNGDGKPDLAVATSDDKLTILLGKGNGMFTTGATLATADHPVAVRAADLNGDGKPDLVNSNGYGNSLGVFLGNGDGTFQSAETLPTGTDAFDLAIADVNGDGKPDLVNTNVNAYSNGSVSVFLGNGNGTFQGAMTFGTGSLSEPTSVEVADFDLDGKPDLAVSSPITGNLEVLSGNGDGTFQAPQPYSLGGYTGYGAAATDINGDGRPDLLLTTFNRGTVVVLINSATTQYGLQAPMLAVAGQGFSLTVTAETAANQVDTHYIGTVHFTSSDPQAVLPADYTFTAAD
jgi:hypothetical protein